VALTYYALDYRDLVGDAILEALNGVIAERTRAWEGLVADGFGAFGVASNFGDSCAAGLLIRLPSGACDILAPATFTRRRLAATSSPTRSPRFWTPSRLTRLAGRPRRELGFTVSPEPIDARGFIRAVVHPGPAPSRACPGGIPTRPAVKNPVGLFFS
jgi:hypothetical protein